MYNYNSPNPMLDHLNQLNGSLPPQLNNLSQIKNIMNVLRNAKNPQSILQILIQKNPQLRNIMNYIK